MRIRIQIKAENGELLHEVELWDIPKEKLRGITIGEALNLEREFPGSVPVKNPVFTPNGV